MNLWLLLAALGAAPAPESQCEAWWKTGQTDRLHSRCAQEGAAGRRQYWSLRLTRDPNDLRKQLASAALLRRDSLDPRTLLLAAQYHFGREQVSELRAIQALAKERFPRDKATEEIAAWMPR